MKLTENIEKFIRSRKPRITTDRDADKRILDDSFAAMEAAKAELTGGRPNPWSFLLASKVTRLAVAALIIVAIAFLGHRISREQVDDEPVSQVSQSPAEMLTYASLTVAYRQGGFEEVEKQCEKAFERLGPRPEALSPQELLGEFNGS